MLSLSFKNEPLCMAPTKQKALFGLQRAETLRLSKTFPRLAGAQSYSRSRCLTLGLSGELPVLPGQERSLAGTGADPGTDDGNNS